MPSCKVLFGTLILSLAVTACAEAPPPASAPAPAAEASSTPSPEVAVVPGPPVALPPPPQPTNLHCDALVLRQDGREIAAVNGVFLLNRRPFSILYTGEGREPSLYLSTRPTLNDALDQLGQREVWASADEVFTESPDDLPIRDGARLISDPDTQDLFLAGMGESYPVFFRQMVIMNDEPAVILAATRSGMGFEQRGGAWVLPVRGLGGLPVAQTRFRQLDLTYFATLERLGPGGKGSFGSRNLMKLAWGSCRLAFLGRRF